MNTANASLSTLKRELEFLDHGGYRTPVGSRQALFCMETPVEWRQPLFFEDSPSCPKKRYEACYPERDCVLMDFVPAEHRHGKVPCRHILLSESGETIDSLSKAGAKEKQLETALRDWLVTTITKLDSATAA